MIAVAEKKPVQVYLDQTQLKTLTLLAEKLGISRAAVLRRGLERLAKEAIPVEEDPALKLIGLMGEDAKSPGELSTEHDRYLVEWSANA